MSGINDVIKHFADKDLADFDHELARARSLMLKLAIQRDYTVEHKKSDLPANLLIDPSEILNAFGFEKIDEITTVIGKRITPWVLEWRQRSRDLRRHIPYVIGLKSKRSETIIATRYLLLFFEHTVEENGEVVRCGIIPEREREVLARIKTMALESFSIGHGRSKTIAAIEARLDLEMRCEQALESLHAWQRHAKETLEEPLHSFRNESDEQLVKLISDFTERALDIETRPTARKVS